MGANDAEKHLSTTVIVILPLLMICQLTNSFLQHRFPKVMHYLPEVGVIIIIGIATGCLIAILRQFGVPADPQLEHFSPTLFFVGLLPPIIFNSGFHLKRNLFFVNLSPIMVFAVFGTLLSAGMISVGLYYLQKAGMLGGSSAGNDGSMAGLTWAECWTFGGLISATDPVSTLVLFAELRVEPHLFYLIFGESVMNDAVGLVLFENAREFILNPPKFSNDVLGEAVGTFIIDLVGSLLVGVILAAFMALIVKKSHLKENIVLEQGLVVLFVYLPYVVGEVCNLSGIVTTLTAGMASRKFIYPNLNKDSQDGVVGVLRMLSGFAETAAFLNLGLSCVLYNAEYYNGNMIFWSIVMCTFSRPIQIYFLSWMLNKMGIPHPLDWKTQHMISFSGLRGVVAFACVTMWPNDEDAMGKDGLDRRKVFITTTSCVILFTVFVQGGLSYSMLKLLGIETDVDEDALEVKEKKPWLVKYVLERVNRYITPFVTPDQNEGDEDESYHDHCDDFDKFTVLTLETPVNKSKEVALQEKLVKETDRPNNRTLSDMPSVHTGPRMDLRRSYSEGAAPGDIALDDFEKRAPKESGSIYSFVHTAPKKKERQFSRQNSRQTSKSPRVVSTVIEEIPSQLHAAAQEEGTP